MMKKMREQMTMTIVAASSCILRSSPTDGSGAERGETRERKVRKGKKRERENWEKDGGKERKTMDEGAQGTGGDRRTMVGGEGAKGTGQGGEGQRERERKRTAPRNRLGIHALTRDVAVGKMHACTHACTYRRAILTRVYIYIYIYIYIMIYKCIYVYICA